MPRTKPEAQKKQNSDCVDANQILDRGTKKSSNRPKTIPVRGRKKSDSAVPKPCSELPKEATSKTSQQQDVREALFNGRAKGPAHEISVKRDEVAAIHGFMIDLDRKILDPGVIGEDSAKCSNTFYEHHVSEWLDRDSTLSKAEVRSTGGGLHAVLWLDKPVLCEGGQQGMWDQVARGLRSALPGDPNVNGINAMTRPVGATNGKFDPPRVVTQLREGQPLSKDEV